MSIRGTIVGPAASCYNAKSFPVFPGIRDGQENRKPPVEPPLVIVESPAKARTISKFLGRGYTIEASIGHIRDLPQGAKEIPEQYKKEDWAHLGVNVNARLRAGLRHPPRQEPSRSASSRTC